MCAMCMHYVLARLNKLLDSLVDTNYNLNVRSDGRRKTAIVNLYFTIIRMTDIVTNMKNKNVF